MDVKSAMETIGKALENATAPSDPASQRAIPISKPRQEGRLLRLNFRGNERPELYKIEFCYDDRSKFTCYERGVTRYFGWTEVPLAVSLIFLDYLYHSFRKRRDQFKFEGGKDGRFNNSLHHALNQDTGIIPGIFARLPLAGGGVVPCPKDVFHDAKRSVRIKSDFLPPDCIEAFWHEVQQTGPSQIKTLADAIRRSQDEPVEPELPAADEDPPVTSETNASNIAGKNAVCPNQEPAESTAEDSSNKLLLTPGAITGTAVGINVKTTSFVGSTDLPAGIEKKLPTEQDLIRDFMESCRLPSSPKISYESTPENEERNLRRMSELLLKTKRVCSADITGIRTNEIKAYLWASLPKLHSLDNIAEAIKDWPGMDSSAPGEIAPLKTVAECLLNDKVKCDMTVLVSIFEDAPNSNINLPAWAKKRIADAFLQEDELIHILSGKVALSRLDTVKGWLVHCSDFFPSEITENIFLHLVSRAYVQTKMPKLEILPLILRLLNNVPSHRRNRAVSAVASFYLRNDARELRWITEHGGRPDVLEFVTLMREEGLRAVDWPDWLKPLLAC